MKWDISRVYVAFNHIEKVGWDTSVPLEWCFYFLDEDKSRLMKVYDELKDFDYKIDRIELLKDIWQLVVSKTEILTPEKLHRRNLAFEELADYCNISCYDGWDVSKITK